MPLLEVNNISKYFKGVEVLQNISFTQLTSQKIAIAGISGSGKSTLLKIIAGLVQADEGYVLLNSQRVIGPHDKLMPGHKSIAYLSQHYELLNNYRVEEIIWFENKIDINRANSILEICKISHLLHRTTHELSGGEKQRIALCILLLHSPSLLLLDEPYSNLDPINTAILKEVVENITTELSITCLLTSHDANDTLPWADEIIVLKDGALVQKGSPEEIYLQPVNEYVAAMFGEYNIIDPLHVQLFKSTEGLSVDGLSMIVRPEHFIINYSSQGVFGTVTKTRFNGGHFIVHVQMKEFEIICRTNNDKLKQGDTVSISLQPGKEWFL